MGGREIAERSFAPITPEHLRLLSRLAGEEREAFFERNPTQIPLYRDRFIAAALCQGAALHYLGKGDGVKDFDIHLFYVQHPDRGQMARTVRSIRVEVPGFGPRKIDFIRTVVPGRLIQGPSGDRVVTLRRFLEVGQTKNARHLAEKAVIGLIPEAILGMVVWPGPYGGNTNSTGPRTPSPISSVPTRFKDRSGRIDSEPTLQNGGSVGPVGFEPKPVWVQRDRDGRGAAPGFISRMGCYHSFLGQHPL